MSNIQIAIEGEDAVSATEELLQIPGISGNYTTPEEIEREGTIATVATIVGIVGGTLTIAEQIRKWYLEYKQSKSGKKIAKVLIVGKNGERLILEGATAEQIQKVLSS
ncbi:hypothetical protein NIES267_18590 [Calothrix parasitica NIES-267]|uniref:Uncharacterized protein n=1 Tax=Calothrix parasitica NIES-267 TaxID=1973488 RepID=A0A1Z4LMF8_9CYAN|nr:hypothetical protein NIES267_18590 [Calothrix parasitica NIES-267]